MPFTSTTRDVPATRRSRVWRRVILLLLAAAWIGTGYWQANKPLLAGAHVDSPWYPLIPGQATFFADVTSSDAYGRPIVSQAIFDEVLKVVHSARRFVVLDYFLFNDRPGVQNNSGVAPRQLSGELRDALIELRRTQPNVRVLLLTDPINEVYGDAASRDFRLLRAAGVDVVVVDLERLRDSNFIYSSLWRLGIGWWSGDGRSPGASGDGGKSPAAGFPNPLDESATPTSFGAWARLLNFKSDHRKVVIADDGHDGTVAIVGSANPHDASSANSNAALRIAGPVTAPLLRSELAIAHASGWKGRDESMTSATTTPEPNANGAGRVKILTEGAIRAELLERLDGAVQGDNIDIAMFYVADRGIVEALQSASRRGVTVRLLLDPNKDAFGHAETGIPNQPVASELVASSDGAIHVRWYRTHGEQFHTKLVLIHGPERLWFTLGSSNLTRRNLLDYDLEANVAVEVGRDSELGTQMLVYFETMWSNRASLGIEYSADFGYYADPSQLNYWLYRVMEGTGASTF